MTRAPSATDVFTAVAEDHRREILDLLAGGERAVGEIVTGLAIAQPRVSKHLRTLSDAGLVECRAVGRRRLYRLDAAGLRPLHDWVARYEPLWGGRLDRLDDYLDGLQRRAGGRGPGEASR